MKGFKVEQVNPNDLQYLVSAKHFDNGDRVKVGQILFEVEGQKATFDVFSELEGYVFSHFGVDDYFDVDACTYFLSDNKDDILPNLESDSNESFSKKTGNSLDDSIDVLQDLLSSK